MDTAERIANVISIVQRIENKLDAWADTPQEVKDLRRELDALRKAEQSNQETWQDALYRTLTTLAGLIKPKRRPTGDSREIENRGNIPPDGREPQ